MSSRTVSLVLIVVLIAFPWLFLGRMAGDAVIHLVFAESALRGDWFAFNPGEPSAGETSTGYMLAVMAVMTLVGQSLAPSALVVMGYVAWLATLFFWFRTWRRLFPDSFLPYMGVLFVGLMPGSVLNSVMGMENVYMALGVAWVMWWLNRNNALEHRLQPRERILLGFVLGCVTLLRPEAILFAAGVIGWRWLWMMRIAKVDRRHADLELAVLSSVVIVMFGGMLLACWLVGGVLPFGGGLARLDLAASAGIELGPVVLQAKLLERLAAYAPLTFAWGLGLASLLRNPAGVNRDFAGLAVVLTLGFVIAYSTILPTAHLGRYTIFFWPLLLTVGLYGIANPPHALATRYTLVRICVVLMTVVLAGVYSYEFYLRKPGRSGHLLSDLTAIPAERKKLTDELLDMLEYEGRYPVSIGKVEVQSRYFYDHRVVIRSMDGIVDSLFGQFVQNGQFDYSGYLRARRVDYLMDYRDLNTIDDDWSPAALRRLPKGTVVWHDGVRFERGAGRVTRITYTDDN